MIGIIDDDGVGIWDVDTIFYYGSGKENVVLVVYEAHYDFLQFLWLHLPVSDSNSAVGDVAFYYLTHLVESSDAVADEINLSVSRHFEIDGVSNQFCGECSYLCVDRLTVGWGSTHNTHIAGSHQRELQGSWNRGC